MAKENPMQQMKKKMYMNKYVYSGKHWSELKFYDHMMTERLSSIFWAYPGMECRMPERYSR